MRPQVVFVIGGFALIALAILWGSLDKDKERVVAIAETYGFSSVVIIDRTTEIDERGNSVSVFYCVATNASGSPAVVKVIKAEGNYWKIRVQGDLPD